MTQTTVFETPPEISFPSPELARGIVRHAILTDDPESGSVALKALFNSTSHNPAIVSLAKADIERCTTAIEADKERLEELGVSLEAFLGGRDYFAQPTNQRHFHHPVYSKAFAVIACGVGGVIFHIADPIGIVEAVIGSAKLDQYTGGWKSTILGAVVFGAAPLGLMWSKVSHLANIPQPDEAESYRRKLTKKGQRWSIAWMLAIAATFATDMGTPSSASSDPFSGPSNGGDLLDQVSSFLTGAKATLETGEWLWMAAFVMMGTLAVSNTAAAIWTAIGHRANQAREWSVRKTPEMVAREDEVEQLNQQIAQLIEERHFAQGRIAAVADAADSFAASYGAEIKYGIMRGNMARQEALLTQIQGPAAETEAPQSSTIFSRVRARIASTKES